MKMPISCCVPGCNGNYANGPKVSTFSFPKDELLRKRWVVAIRRKDFNITRYSSVCELHFKKTDFETETSVFDSKTGRTVTAPLYVKRLKKGVIPSILYPSSPNTLNRESPAEKRKRLETEQLELALRKSSKSAHDKNSPLKDTTIASPGSPAFRSPENKVNEEVKVPKKRGRKPKASKTLRKNGNTISSSNSLHECQSNGSPEISASENPNDRNIFPAAFLPVCIKEEPQWETECNLSGAPANNNTVENMQITDIKSISSSDDSTETAPSEEENFNKSKERFDGTFYSKPMNIDERDKAFGNFIACEMSDLRENLELYMKTKQCILKVLTEAHFEQMSNELDLKIILSRPDQKMKLVKRSESKGSLPEPCSPAEITPVEFQLKECSKPSKTKPEKVESSVEKSEVLKNYEARYNRMMLQAGLKQARAPRSKRIKNTGTKNVKAPSRSKPRRSRKSKAASHNKTSRSLEEKIRRKRIHILFQRLRATLPNIENKQKLSNRLILATATQYVNGLRKTDNEFCSRESRLKDEISERLEQLKSLIGHS